MLAWAALLAAAGVMGLALSGCASSPSAATAPVDGLEINGTVMYDDSITLPKGARLHVTVLDTATPGSSPLAQRALAVAGAPPFDFSVSLRENSFDPPRRPTLFAQVIVAGRPWFSNAVTPVILLRELVDSEVDVILQNDMQQL